MTDGAIGSAITSIGTAFVHDPAFAPPRDPPEESENGGAMSPALNLALSGIFPVALIAHPLAKNIIAYVRFSLASSSHMCDK